MRENNFPPDQPGPDIPPVPPSASTSDNSFGDPTVAGHAPPLSNGDGAIQKPDGRWRQRVLWLCLGLVLAAIGVVAIKMAHLLQDERALQNVARVAMRPAVPDIAPAGRPTATPPQLAGAMPLPGEAQQPAAPMASNAAPLPATAERGERGIAAAPPPASAPGARLASPAPRQDGVSALDAKDAAREGAGAAGEAGGKADDVPGMAANGDGDVGEQPHSAGAAREAARARKQAAAAARAARRQEMSRRGIAVQDTARGSDTFRRCPALGKKGAVTCRIHICNGGAGKERVCRPYLERRP